ncbi:MAG: glycosyltransferase family 4 protein, partial [Acidobacteria bacterium]|nr:glycosyltransferase family 4 protein [Acidobacteriota bacterium]
AYPSARPEPAKIADAVSFWATHGVSESDGRSNVCFFGTLGRQFDLNTLLVAARYLQESAPALRFVLCGTGDKEAALREAARSCSNVLFPGWVDPAQMWTLMRMSCIGLAPYLPTGNFIDHIPNKPVEYLSAGLPVLTTLPGTLGQLLLRKNCGVVYRTGDAAELAGHLKHLHEDPAKLRTLSRNAAALYRESFCAETVYSDLVRHLEHIAGTSAAKTKIKAHTLNSLPNSDRKRLL